MYEAITYEKLVSEMLDTALAQTSTRLDTREGSMLWYGVAPAAVVIQNLYIQLDWILDQSFADTAARAYLIRRAAERGLSPYPATPSVIRAEFTPAELEVALGSRFSMGLLNFIVTEKESAGVYQLTCETPGSGGNLLGEALLPIEYIPGLKTAKATELLIPGDDEEETEHFRARYIASLRSQSYGGNIAQYKEWVETIDGTGGCKVYPIWNGGGTVKIVVIDSTWKSPSPELIELVQTTLDPIPNQGEGIGLAPIGHTVTVEGVADRTVNISVLLTFAEGYEWESVREQAETAVDGYFDELAKEWADSELPLIVRISQIEVRLLGIPGIIDISGTTINDAETNLQLGADEIPVRGTINAATD